MASSELVHIAMLLGRDVAETKSRAMLGKRCWQRNTDSTPRLPAPTDKHSVGRESAGVS